MRFWSKIAKVTLSAFVNLYDFIISHEFFSSWGLPEIWIFFLKVRRASYPADYHERAGAAPRGGGGQLRPL